MNNDVEAFATHLAAAWRSDAARVDDPVLRWLSRFGPATYLPEPDTCADGWSLLDRDGWLIRWYDDGERLLGFSGGHMMYVIPWREIDVFLRRLDTCEDDETPSWNRQLSLAG